MAEISPEQQLHRDTFGRAITIWMKRHGWSQQFFHDLSACIDNAGGVYNSQTSLLQRGRLDFKPQFMVALGNLNAYIAAGDWKLINPATLEGKCKNPGHTARSLRDRLVDAEPFLTADGRVATATDFYGMFVGEVPLNAIYAAATVQPISDKEAKKLSEELRKEFRAIAQAQMLSPAEAWPALERHCIGMDADQQTRFREVLTGWSDYSGEEATNLIVPDHESKPAQALAAWAA